LNRRQALDRLREIVADLRDPDGDLTVEEVATDLDTIADVLQGAVEAVESVRRLMRQADVDHLGHAPAPAVHVEDLDGILGADR
jgi:hypothetical protein